MKKKVQKLNCWEFFECNKKECPGYKSKDPKCWFISGTYCRDEIQGKFLEKMEMCLDCKVLKLNIDNTSTKEICKDKGATFYFTV